MDTPSSLEAQLARIETSLEWIKWILGGLFVLITGQYAILFRILLKLTR
jgi:hypothetical protein